MSTAVTNHEAVTGDAHDSHEHAHKPNSYYVGVALVLAVLTAIETSTYWIDFGPLFMPVLLGLMAVKFFMVVMIFMHLREERPIFKMLFFAGLGLAVCVYLAALLTFHVFFD